MTTENDEASEPDEVHELRRTLMRLPGIRSVSVEPKSLAGLDVQLLRLAPFADLPSGTLRRTDGGRPGEFVIQIWLELEKTTESWTTLEFLGWFVRDAGRGGEISQMRVRGLPPSVGGQVQLGTTLRFVIEWFGVDPDSELETLLARIREGTRSLTTMMALYGNVLGIADEPSA